MSLLPRWELMTDEARDKTKRIIVSAVLLLLSIWVIRSLIPLVIVTLLGYWTLKWLLKNN